MWLSEGWNIFIQVLKYCWKPDRKHLKSMPAVDQFIKFHQHKNCDKMLNGTWFTAIRLKSEYSTWNTITYTVSLLGHRHGYHSLILISCSLSLFPMDPSLPPSDLVFSLPRSVCFSLPLWLDSLAASHWVTPIPHQLTCQFWISEHQAINHSLGYLLHFLAAWCK